jgi:HAE1 family hydrophobic/amphiphilic exporter-1
MKIVDFAIRRPVTVFIFAVAAVVFGVVAFRNLAVNLLPDITYPSLTVRTELEGTAPVEVESLLTRTVENAVGVVNNVVRVTSSSRADISEVTLEFAWGTNMDFAALDVRERLDRVRLPAAADQPLLLRYDPSRSSARSSASRASPPWWFRVGSRRRSRSRSTSVVSPHSDSTSGRLPTASRLKT